ncbi:MAG: lamin tail domain-containing protein [Planctomycetota bacterium]
MRIPLAIAALGLCLATPALKAQVLISEVDFVQRSNEAQWIELINLSQQSVDLSGYCVGLETRTPEKPKQYFFGFPDKTVLGAGKVLRLHWLAPVKDNQVCPGPNGGLEVFTGDTIYHFLFGLGAEPLPAAVGAIGLFNSQISANLAKKESVVDWVQWGSTGWVREGLAIAANRWVSGTFGPVVNTALSSPPSLANNYQGVGKPSSGFEHWYLDSQPTPCNENTGGGAYVISFGTSCKGPHASAPVLSTNGVPKRGVGGGTAFEKFVMTLSPIDSGQVGLWMFSAGRTSLPIFQCTLYVDPLLGLQIYPMIPTTGAAEVRFDAVPTNVLIGVKLVNQGLVASGTGLSFSNGLEFQFGQ